MLPDSPSDAERSARRLLREASLELTRLRRIRGPYRSTWRRIARARAQLACAAALLATAAPAPATARTPIFQSPFLIPAVADWASPAFGDLDGDGDVDALVGESSGHTILFENTGSVDAPAFAGPSIDPFGLAGDQFGAFPALADLEGDGDLDALVGDRYGNTHFFENTGTANAPAFGPPATNALGLARVQADASPELVDIDGDGDLDAFVGSTEVRCQYGCYVSRNYGVTIFFENTGTANAPTFGAPSATPFGLAEVRGWAMPAFADVDGDGDFDAFVGDLYGDTIFFPNTGSASAPAFATPSTNPFGLAGGSFFASPAFADIDADGDLDGLVGETSGHTFLFRNTGSASAPAFVASPGPPFGMASLGSRSSPAALADLDGDGDLDALVGAFDGNTLFFRNTGTENAAAFAPPLTNPFGLAKVGYIATPALADIDGDGDLDAFVAHSHGDTILFENTGTANAPAFAAPSSGPFGLAAVANPSPAFGDIDGDGDLDAFVAERHVYGDAVFFENTGTASSPAFGAAERNPFGLSTFGIQNGPALADLDGDGDLDAAMGDPFGNVVYFANTGSASAAAFAPPSINAFGLTDVPRGPAAPAFGDLDGDGDLDTLVGNYNGNTFFFENRALGAGSCTDDIDNDLDGKIDLGSDPGCASEDDLDENGAPVALCEDVVASTTQDLCGASVEVDGGSSDPDGDGLRPEQSPPGPYPPGTTSVSLQVTDPLGASDSCTARVSVIDETPPTIDCGPERLSRPSGPAGLPSVAGDNCGLASVTTSAPDCFVIKKDGRRIDRPCDLLANLSFRDFPKKKTHVTWSVTARDAAGNEASQDCETVVGKRRPLTRPGAGPPDHR